MNKLVYVAMVVFGLVACEKSVSESTDATVVDSDVKVVETDAAPADAAVDVPEVLMTSSDSGSPALAADAAKDATKKD